ncbi:hypothetical protein [Streptomyces sp. NPDC057494]|uniref:hypothetical protein n=1 Tax=Streptomyces sp. NPDC057494 TaxID=3346148 RepID=UPI0036BEC192
MAVVPERRLALYRVEPDEAGGVRERALPCRLLDGARQDGATGAAGGVSRSGT